MDLHMIITISGIFAGMVILLYGIISYDKLKKEEVKTLDSDKGVSLSDENAKEIKKEEHATLVKKENLEIEETQLKLEITEIINDQLYNEVMEILEHIALSRKRPELYQDKSICACEEIPKLVFQQTSNENNKKNQINEEDLINVE